MVKIKRDINQQGLTVIFDINYVNCEYFYPLEVVDRVNETQLQVGDKSN